MFDIRAFSNFNAASCADKADSLMLEKLKEARDESQARFVNFSIFDYRTENPDSVHFITYPPEWLLYYARNSCAAKDPLLNSDYRHTSSFDWRDVFTDDDQTKILDALSEFGIGNEAYSIVKHAGGRIYTVTSLVFRCESERWPWLKRSRMERFQGTADRLTQYYRHAYMDRDPMNSLTPRELQVLELAAMGHSDKGIGNMMRIGKWTVVSHIRSAKEKLGCKNRTAAVATAITHGLINIKRLA
jgi:DNA-binding CsgD family transcriptional regulator